jgi:hypothetical protein
MMVFRSFGRITSIIDSLMDFIHFFKCQTGREYEVGVVATLGYFWSLKRIAHYLCRKNTFGCDIPRRVVYLVKDK